MCVIPHIWNFEHKLFKTVNIYRWMSQKQVAWVTQTSLNIFLTQSDKVMRRIGHCDYLTGERTRNAHTVEVCECESSIRGVGAVFDSIAPYHMWDSNPFNIAYMVPECVLVDIPGFLAPWYGYGILLHFKLNFWLISLYSLGYINGPK